MADLRTQLRDYLDATAPPVEHPGPARPLDLDDYRPSAIDDPPVIDDYARHEEGSTMNRKMWTIGLVAAAAVVLIVVGVVATAGGDDDAPVATEGGTEQGSSTSDLDPCTLLTDEQAAEMVGAGATSTPTDTGECQWAGAIDLPDSHPFPDSDGLLTLTLTVLDDRGYEAGISEYEEDTSYETFEILDGIGDQAWVAMTPLGPRGAVLVGEVAIDLDADTGGDRDTTVGLLEQIAANL